MLEEARWSLDHLRVLSGVNCRHHHGVRSTTYDETSTMYIVNFEPSLRYFCSALLQGTTTAYAGHLLTVDASSYKLHQRLLPSQHIRPHKEFEEC
jgi:hypothetical protein